MCNQQDRAICLKNVDEIITTTEAKIDNQLDLIESLQLNETDMQQARIVFTSLVNVLDELTQLRLVIQKAMTQ